jgi:hypothetical protein
VNAPALRRARSLYGTPVRELARRGLASGVVAGASALGVLFGVGRRAGTAWRPVNAAAHSVIGAPADGLWTYHGSVTPVGGLVVLAMSIVAGFAVALLAPSFRLRRIAAAAAVVALAGYLLHLHVAGRTPGGLAALLTVGELRGMYLVLGVSLVAGMRFAFSRSAAAPKP